MPVSKSFAQRAIIAAALADGTSHLKGYTPCGDNEAALQVARNLGAEVSVDGNVVTIKGISASLGGLKQLLSADGTPSQDEDGTPVLHVGESGLLTRMMIPIMSQIGTEAVKFTGEKTLLGRPLTGAKEIMDAFEAELSSCDPARGEGFSDVQNDPVRVPLTVKGPLKAGRVEYRADRYGICHVPLGKVSFPVEKLAENYGALFTELLRVKPSTAKGRYVKSVVVSTTMGPGVRLDPMHTRDFLAD
jgi:5-enolpyruvylshikimate-3-phosphate synthase